MKPLAAIIVVLSMLAGCLDEPSPTPEGGASVLPDTLALPFLPLDAFLRPPPDSGCFNTLGTVSGWTVCPPCPPGAQCEPCPPFGVTFEAPAPGGRARVGVEFEPGTPQDTTLLRRGGVYALSVEVRTFTAAVYADPAFGRDSTQRVMLRGLGFTLTPRAALYPTKQP